jgi:hypothetical protein
MQVGGMDKSLRNRIYNLIVEAFFGRLVEWSHHDAAPYEFEVVCRHIWKDYFENPVDEIPSFSDGGFYANGFRNYFKLWYESADFCGIYDFVEYIIDLEEKLGRAEFRNALVDVLEREMSGYCLVDNVISPITNEQEIEEIEKATSIKGKFDPVAKQLKSALNLLSDRFNPDYRNSIKDSIMAVESLCRIITADSNATLGAALKQIEISHKLHPALKAAFSALYGYTSDAGGIRHGLLEDDITIDQADAVFMLVTCSAFVNYMTSKSSK